MTDQPFNEHRLEQVEQLENQDENPYPTTEDLSPDSIESFVEAYEDQENIESEDNWVLAGRVVRENEFGDFVFYDIDDRTETVQVMCSVDDRSDFETEDYYLLSNISRNDWVVFEGHPDRSNTGELTLNAEEFQVVGPSLQDTANNRNQLSEENRITQRTAALGTSDELYETVGSRFEIENQVRSYLINQGYTQVRTPTLHNMAGGAEATPFETHCQALDRNVFLRIAPELYLKRLIIAGYDQIFDMASCFRNEDIDTTHNPEFTMLELYERFSTYEDMMDLTEQLFAYVAEEITGATTIEYDENEVDLEPPWNRVRFDELIEEVFDENIENLDRRVVEDYLVEYHGIDRDEVSEIELFDELLMEVFEEEIEPNIRQPTFVTDYPASSTPLCKRHEDNEDRVQRFEGFILGMEVANSYTELTDPRDQRQRLIDQAGSEEDINEEFVQALSYGMPPTAGLGIGIDRMAMILTDSQSIKDIIAYPMTHSRV